MHGGKGQGRPKACGQQNLLLTVACPEDEMPYAYRSSLHPYSQNPCPGGPTTTKPSNHTRDSWQARSRPRILDEESLFAVNMPPTQPQRRAPRTTTANTIPAGRRNILYRCFQVLSILIIGVSVYALVENVRYLVQTYGTDDFSQEDDVNNPKSFFNINEELQSWVIHEKPDVSKSHQPYPPVSPSLESVTTKEFLISTTTTEAAGSTDSTSGQKYVLNIESLSFDLNNSSMCLTSNSSDKPLGQGIYFMIIVHSAPEHFEARQAIRSTWGSVKSLKNFSIRLIFILGKCGDWVEDADLVESSIQRESEIFGDIVTGTFVDSYRNLTYKHLLGYKWVLEYCPGSAFILKADDDAFIDMFQLFDFITRTYGFKPSQGTLVCNVFPEGTKPVRATDTKGTKWAVTPDEYPHVIYPKYCGGLAYLATPDVVGRILDASDKVRFFWIDDVFVTGILRELAGVEPFYLNLRYSYEAERYRKWLATNNNNNSKPNGSSGGGNNSSANLVVNRNKKFPFMIAHVERGPNFGEEMNHLWRKTLKIWSDEQK